MSRLSYGIHANLNQFLHLLLQVLFVGSLLGTMRTVVPALATSEFRLPNNSYIFLTTFVAAFGIAKAVLNFISGELSELIGRKNTLLVGWFVAVPIPLLTYFAESWWWIVSAALLLGVNQGLTWSMTQTSKLDFIRYNERGFAIGMNEAAGYIGLSFGGVLSAYLATILNPRLSLLICGMCIILLALNICLFFIKDTLSWSLELKQVNGELEGHQVFTSNPQGLKQVFKIVSWQDKRLMAICQAGLVEKFVDAIIWTLYPVLLLQAGISLKNLGLIIGIYGLVWGLLQPITGKLSDKIGRHKLNVWGMWVCAYGIASIVLNSGVVWYCISSAVSGLGMAMLYPNLSAAVADIANQNWRASAIGVYRFWRDLGYAIGALGIGIVAHLGHSVDIAFWFVSLCMLISGLILWLWGEESLIT